MKRGFRILILVLIVGVFLYTLYYLYSKNQKPPQTFETAEAFYTDIQKKSVATGSIIPREEIEIKPQVSGIIEKIFVEAGDQVEEGELLARIKVIPDMVSLNNSEARVEQAEIQLENATKEFNRSKDLFEKDVIATTEFQQAELSYNIARQELETASENLLIVKEGAGSRSGQSALTMVRSTVDGMVLDVPVKEGNQVIESNNFNDGTTVASVADMSDLIFEGKIDESEVGKIKEGMEITLTIGAIEDQKFPAQLEYIAPKGVEENGAIQFLIRARVENDTSNFIRAGYSANADIVLDRRDSVLSVREALVQYDEEGTAFVEVETAPGQFERRNIQQGLSDGINVEVVDGISAEDRIKVWNAPEVME